MWPLQGEVAGAQETRKLWQIYSPIQGHVLRVLQESAGVVAAGTPLLELADAADLEVVVDVLSTDAVQIHPGTPVHIERWGLDLPLEGRVRVIELGALTKVSALGVEEQRVNVIEIGDARFPLQHRLQCMDAGIPERLRWLETVDGYPRTGGITLAISFALFPHFGDTTYRLRATAISAL